MDEDRIYLGYAITTPSGADTGTVQIGEFPGRKRFALYTTQGARCTPLAYFRSREAAEEAIRLIRLLASARESTR